MSAIIVSVPQKDWPIWSGVVRSGLWGWKSSGKVPPVEPGDRLFVAALGRIQGYGDVRELVLGDLKPPTWEGGRPSRRWIINCWGWYPVANGPAFTGLSTWVYAERFGVDL